MPGPSYQLQWPDAEPDSEDSSRERPGWWRPLLLACLALLLVVIAGIVGSSIVVRP